VKPFKGHADSAEQPFERFANLLCRPVIQRPLDTLDDQGSDPFQFDGGLAAVV
jgi:hypothetical protein